MSSDYEYSDDDQDYYDDDDEDMMDTQEDGQSSSWSSAANRGLTQVPGSAPSDAEMDMDAFNDDFKVSSKGKQKSYEIDFESLTQAAVEKLMQSDVEHISGIFGVDVSNMNHSTPALVRLC